MTPLHVVEYVGVKSIRSITPLELVKLVEKARARLRQTVSYRSCYVLNNSGEKLYGFEPHPGYDIFFLTGLKTKTLLNKLGLRDPPENPLIIRKFNGIHEIYSGTEIVGRLVVPDEGRNIVVEELSSTRNPNPYDKLLESNKAIIDEHVKVSRKILGSPQDYDLVVVSFSGGKDSVVALDLAVKHFGVKKVKAIYVDTGLEFPQTLEYVDLVGEYYGIDIVKAYAGLDKAVKERGLPTISNRWCTAIKTRVFSVKLRKLSEKYDKVLIVVGGRDAESVSRSRRPPLKVVDEKFVEVLPIKQWSIAHVQLYMLINRLPINPLYEYGFYRIGCHICPALRGLELFIMDNFLSNTIYGRMFVREFLREKKWVKQ